MRRFISKALSLALLLALGSGCATKVKETLAPNVKKGWVEFYTMLEQNELDYWDVYQVKNGADIRIGSRGIVYPRHLGLGKKEGFKTDGLPGSTAYIIKYGTAQGVVTVNFEEGMVIPIRVEIWRTGTTYNTKMYETTKTTSFDMKLIEGGQIPVARTADALPALKQALKHDDWGTRMFAATAAEEMARFLDEEAIETLRALKADTEKAVQVAALNAVIKWQKVRRAEEGKK